MFNYLQRLRERSQMRRRAKACKTILFTREGCGLCEEANELLARYGFEPELVDIDSDVNLRRDFGESIPVVEIDGKVRFRGQVNSTLLLRLLRS